jgi:hypothetical protein
MLSTDNFFEQNFNQQNKNKGKKQKEKKEKKFIEMGPQSYEHTFKANEEREQRKREASERVKNKTFTREDLQKTKFCKHSDCKYGANCVYAHSVDELIIHKCEFGDDCDFITITNGKVFNAGKKICRFKHDSETMDECKKRLNITQPVKPPPPPPSQDVPPPPPSQDVPPPKVSLEAKPNVWVKDKTPSVRVIQVPKELASQALEMAYKAGSESFRIEIY